MCSMVERHSLSSFFCAASFLPSFVWQFALTGDRGVTIYMRWRDNTKDCFRNFGGTPVSWGNVKTGLPKVGSRLTLVMYIPILMKLSDYFNPLFSHSMYEGMSSLKL